MKDVQAGKKLIDVVITSSSRPHLLRYTIEFFKKFVHYQGRCRFLLNEDILYQKESDELLEYAYEEFGEENVFWHKPPLGLIESIAFILQKVQTKYLFMLQDDWVAERPIELDRVLYLMQRHSEVNYIEFNKYRNRLNDTNYPRKEVFFNAVNETMIKTTSPRVTPSIWRTDFTVPLYLKAKDYKKFPGSGNPIMTAPARYIQYLKHIYKKDVGSYIWGKVGDPRIFRHIGHNFRAEAHQKREDGAKWGTEHASPERAYKINGAPWLELEQLEGI